MAAQQVQEYLERHRIGALFEVRILYLLRDLFATQAFYRKFVC